MCAIEGENPDAISNVVYKWKTSKRTVSAILTEKYDVP
jgi:hypothetical protein